MREMGTVDLLTREGEIRIARRIEEGLKEVIASLARYPRVVELVLELLGAVVEGRSRLNDVVVGFGDRDAPPVPAPRSTAAADKEDGDKQAASTTDEEEVVDTGPTVEEADARLRSLRRTFGRFVAAQGRHGARAKRTVNLRDKLVEEFPRDPADAEGGRRPVEPAQKGHRAAPGARARRPAAVRDGGEDAAAALHQELPVVRPGGRLARLGARRGDRLGRKRSRSAARTSSGTRRSSPRSSSAAGSRSTSSRTSTGASRSARRRRAGPRRRWWKPISGS